MPYRITVEKYNPAFAEYWTNVYWALVNTLSDASVVADSIVTAERPLYVPSTTITKARLDDGMPDTEVFQTNIYNQAGTRDTTGLGDLVPLFVVDRVDFGTVGGRPSRKYLRGGLCEADVGAAGALSTARLTLLANYGLAIVGGTGICDVDGQDLTVAAPWRQAAMRQLRRGSKKKVTP